MWEPIGHLGACSLQVSQDFLINLDLIGPDCKSRIFNPWWQIWQKLRSKLMDLVEIFILARLLVKIDIRFTTKTSRYLFFFEIPCAFVSFILSSFQATPTKR